MNRKKTMVLLVSLVVFFASQVFISTIAAKPSDKHYNNFLILDEKELTPYFDYAKEVVEGYYITGLMQLMENNTKA